MEENRNTLRIWSDRVHRMLGAITAIAVVWIFSQTHTTGLNQAVFAETLENINKSLIDHSTRLTVLETIRIDIARSHYTKPEVESLVDRSIRPLRRDLTRIESKTERIERKTDKIYEVVSK